MHELIILKKSARMAPRSTATSLKGLYARVARKMGCDSSYVSKVARGERRSRRIEIALRGELQLVVRRLLKWRAPTKRQGDRNRHSALT